VNLSHVETFLVAVRMGNLNKAAAALNVTQSTVTARINALESLVGQRLLHRHKSGTALTGAGTRFLRHAEVMVQVWKLARYETSLPRGFEDVCAFGCEHALWTGAGEAWVDALRGGRPTIAIGAQLGGEADTRDWLSNATVDIAISYAPPPASGFAIDLLFEDVFLEVATVRRGLMRWDPSYVYVDLGEDFRRRHAQAYPVDETAIVTFNDSMSAMRHILTWGGSAYLPYRVVREAMAAGRLFEVEGAPRFRRAVYMSRNVSRAASWTWFPDIVAAFRTAIEEKTRSAAAA
jgi:DNA-binding transcriptional LysR family regulator